MLAEVSPYTEPTSVCALSQKEVLGCRLALKEWFWFSCSAEAWLGEGDIYLCAGREIVYVDVLAPTPAPKHRWPVFLDEARRDFFQAYKPFGKGDLLQLLCKSTFSEHGFLKSGRFDNLFLLEGGGVAVVHLSGKLWQLHVKDDIPYVIDQGTRFFALQ